MACLKGSRASGDEDIAWTIYLNTSKPSSYQLKQIQEARWNMLTVFFQFLLVLPQEVFCHDLSQKAEDCYSFSQRYERDHEKHHSDFMQHHDCAIELFKELTKKGAIDIPFLMNYSGNAIDLFAEESPMLMKCFKSSIQYQPSPQNETDEAKIARHARMSAEIENAKKIKNAAAKRSARANMTQEEKKEDQSNDRERKKTKRANMTQEEKKEDQMAKLSCRSESGKEEETYPISWRRRERKRERRAKKPSFHVRKLQMAVRVCMCACVRVCATEWML